MKPRVTPAALGLVLAAAVGAQFLPHHEAVKQASQLSLLPVRGDGWDSRQLPMGDTEVVAANVMKILRYDDLVYREYRSGGRTFSVYAAYWSPGRMPTQIIAAHTPDRCWSSAGWRCMDLNHKFKLPLDPLRIRVGQGRVFRAENGMLQHVVFWHLTGRETYDFGERLVVSRKFSKKTDHGRWFGA